jgi:general secretion pathway protein E
MPEQMYEAVGCKLCRDTGYLGRRGIYEVLVNSPAVQDEIHTRISTRAPA